MKLKEVVEILDSKRIPVSAAERAGRDKVYPYYGAQGIVDYIDDYIFDGEYILVAEDGNNLKTLDDPIVTWASGKFWVNNHAHILGSTDKANLRYVYYYLMAHDLRGLITGSAQPKLNQHNLGQYELNLPSREVQDEVAAFLSTIDEMIDTNRLIIAKLTSLAKTIYDYWFVQFDFPNESKEPYKSSGGKMIWDDSLIRAIPENWAVSKLGIECETLLGGTPDTNVAEYWNGELPWLNSGEVANSPVVTSNKSITQLGLDNSASSFAKAGAVVMSITRYIRPSVLAIDACFNQSVVAVIPNNVYHTAFIYPLMQSNIARYLQLRTGAQQPHINKEIVDNTLVVQPPTAVLDAYYAKVEPLYEAQIDKAFENRELIALRNFLLPMLMNGQIVIDGECIL